MYTSTPPYVFMAAVLNELSTGTSLLFAAVYSELFVEM
jgi:hypothetical protein